MIYSPTIKNFYREELERASLGERMRRVLLEDNAAMLDTLLVFGAAGVAAATISITWLCLVG